MRDRRRSRRQLESRVDTINSFLNAQSWVGARLVVDHEPELVDHLTVDLLEQLRVVAQTRGNTELAFAYDQMSEIITRCLTVGVGAAFDEVVDVRKRRAPKEQVTVPEDVATPPALTAYLEADGLDALDVLAQHPEIISETSIRRIDDYIEHFSRQRDLVSVNTLATRRDYLRRLL